MKRSNVEVYAKGEFSVCGYIPIKLNLTGRWKICTIDGNKIMYIEHKGIIFKKWYRGEDICIYKPGDIISEYGCWWR